MRSQRSLLVLWKQLKLQTQHDVNELDIQIQKLLAQVVDFIDTPNLSESLQNKIAEYQATKNERKFLHRLIKILDRNIDGAEII